MNNLLLDEKSKGSLKQLTRYTLVGIFSNSAGYLVYLILTHLGVMPKIAITLLYGVVALIGYFGNRNLVFSNKGSLLGSSIRYFIAHFFGYLINLAILILLVDQLGYPHQWVQGAAIFVVAGFLFTAFKFFVFKKQNA